MGSVIIMFLQFTIKISGENYSVNCSMQKCNLVCTSKVAIDGFHHVLLHCGSIMTKQFLKQMEQCISILWKGESSQFNIRL
jgi:hypothetical protein